MSQRKTGREFRNGCRFAHTRGTDQRKDAAVVAQFALFHWHAAAEHIDQLAGRAAVAKSLKGPVRDHCTDLGIQSDGREAAQQSRPLRVAANLVTPGQ
jgi:hypothetical protein